MVEISFLHLSFVPEEPRGGTGCEANSASLARSFRFFACAAVVIHLYVPNGPSVSNTYPLGHVGVLVLIHFPAVYVPSVHSAAVPYRPPFPSGPTQKTPSRVLSAGHMVGAPWSLRHFEPSRDKPFGHSGSFVTVSFGFEVELVPPVLCPTDLRASS